MSTNPQPIWMDDSLSDHAFSKAKAPRKARRYGKLTRSAGKPQIICPTAIPASTPVNSVFVRMPADLAARLKKVTSGSYTVATWLLVEQALADLEAGGKTWTFTIEGER